MSRKIHGIEIDKFTEAYMICALWTSSDSSLDYETLDSFNLDDIDIETVYKMVSDCARFQAENTIDLIHVPDVYCSGDSHGRSRYTGLESAGHDFWYTRNGHGVGFWSRDYDEKLRNRLDNASRKYPEFNLYVGDDGKIHGA